MEELLVLFLNRIAHCLPCFVTRWPPEVEYNRSVFLEPSLQVYLRAPEYERHKMVDRKFKTHQTFKSQ